MDCPTGQTFSTIALCEESISNYYDDDTYMLRDCGSLIVISTYDFTLPFLVSWYRDKKIKLLWYICGDKEGQKTGQDVINIFILYLQTALFVNLTVSSTNNRLQSALLYHMLAA